MVQSRECDQGISLIRFCPRRLNSIKKSDYKSDYYFEAVIELDFSMHFRSLAKFSTFLEFSNWFLLGFILIKFRIVKFGN